MGVGGLWGGPDWISSPGDALRTAGEVLERHREHTAE